MRALYLLLVLTMGCVAFTRCSSLVIDPSIKAVQAGDKTLIASACRAMPGQGGDICRVVEGARISEEWVMVLPQDRHVLSGEVSVRYKGIVKSYSVKDGKVTVPWKELTGETHWSREHDGLAQATGTLRFQSASSDAEFMDVLGIALLVVLQEGYNPLPLDSGNEGWKTSCKVQYSTAGRSAIECK